MGYSWSPFLAQSIAWSLLLTPLNDKEILHWCVNQDVLPSFIDLLDDNGNVCGFATVFYDNFLIASSNSDVTEAVMKRLRSNASRFRCTLKESSIVGTKRLILNDDFIGATYLGVQFGLEQRSSKRRSRKLVWRHDPNKIVSWGRLKEKLTYREAMGGIGKVVWHQTISLRPFYEIDTVLEAIRSIVSVVGRKWDEECHIDLSSVRYELLKAMKNQ